MSDFWLIFLVRLPSGVAGLQFVYVHEMVLIRYIPFMQDLGKVSFSYVESKAFRLQSQSLLAFFASLQLIKLGCVLQAAGLQS